MDMVWIDCEMTGLDPSLDTLVEVAALVTDAELNVLGEGVDVVIAPSQEALDHMSEFVTTMHADSGLLELLPGGMTLAQAEQTILDYVRTHVPVPGKTPLAGNSVGTDRAFLAREMPTLEGHLHYRNIDVSSIKELARRWYPRVFFSAPEKHGHHRALGDIQDSINELRYYRDTIFVHGQGPSREEAKRSATAYDHFDLSSPKPTESA